MIYLLALSLIGNIVGPYLAYVAASKQANRLILRSDTRMDKIIDELLVAVRMKPAVTWQEPTKEEPEPEEDPSWKEF